MDKGYLPAYFQGYGIFGTPLYKPRKSIIFADHYIMTVLTLCSADTFASSLDPDQAQQNVGPDLDPKLFDTDGRPPDKSA